MPSHITCSIVRKCLREFVSLECAVSSSTTNFPDLFVNYTSRIIPSTLSKRGALESFRGRFEKSITFVSTNT